MIYVHKCPDTGRMFLWVEGVEGNLSEVFDQDEGEKIAHCLNHFERLFEAAQIAEGALYSYVDKDPGNLELLRVYTNLRRALERARPPEDA